MHETILGLLILIGIGLYFLPSIIAEVRRITPLVAIFSVNLIFGWTVIGWIAAVAWALTEQPWPRPEPDPSLSIETDNWSFHTPNLSETSAIQQSDHWVLGIEDIIESPPNR